jgi:hypothetical protein
VAELVARCEREMECPREVVIWNYFDHEHVVGTHYKHYNTVRVLAEKDGWVLCERFYKLPVINLKTSSLGFMWLENPGLIRSIQHGKLGLKLFQDIILTELGPEKCLVACEYRMEVPAPFKIFQPLFTKILTRWFHATWDEDAVMRLRRWKVWKLGFKDFAGLGYVNDKTAFKPVEPRKYPIELPVPKSTPINAKEGFRRPFEQSIEVGY